MSVESKITREEVSKPFSRLQIFRVQKVYMCVYRKAKHILPVNMLPCSTIYGNK